MTVKLTNAQVKDLNHQYLPRLTVKNADEYLSNSAKRSARIRHKLECHIDLPYGAAVGQKLDVFQVTPRIRLYMYLSTAVAGAPLTLLSRFTVTSRGRW